MTKNDIISYFKRLWTSGTQPPVDDFDSGFHTATNECIKDLENFCYSHPDVDPEDFGFFVDRQRLDFLLYLIQDILKSSKSCHDRCPVAEACRDKALSGKSILNCQKFLFDWLTRKNSYITNSQAKRDAGYFAFLLKGLKYGEEDRDLQEILERYL